MVKKWLKRLILWALQEPLPQTVLPKPSTGLLEEWLQGETSAQNQPEK